MKMEQRLTLELRGEQIRKNALDMVHAAHSGHLGGSFSVADILATLYFMDMTIAPERPGWQDRDRLVLSKGHCTPALYSALALRGYFPLSRLHTFRRIDSNLSGHAEMTKVPGVDMSTGSLGQGASAALGMALAARLDGRCSRVYAICGDGECEEGQIWEMARIAARYRASNLTVIVDDNGIQLDGFTRQIGGDTPIGARFAAFGWNVLTVDGHDPAAVHEALMAAREDRLRPTAVIARTVKGKGVSFMENDPHWHGGIPSEEQFAQAGRQIEERIRHLTDLLDRARRSDEASAPSAAGASSAMTETDKD